MKEIGNGFRKIFKEDKLLLVLMFGLFVFGIFLAVHTLLNFKIGGTTMYIGYSDIGEFSGGEFVLLISVFKQYTMTCQRPSNCH
mgnify:CR=1 FL=1